jgi:UDP-glucose:(glucosyl)LPS alpha-1,2-glucosyltransferase
MNPLGGTELQMNELVKRLPDHYWDKVQITTSVPEKEPLAKDKVNILWQKNSYDQGNLAPWFKNKDNHKKYDWYVFNSHWNYEKFRIYFDIPTDRSVVIKNAIPTTKWVKRDPYKKGDPIKLIHVSTPWRGLNVLLGAMQLVKNPLITLDLYSSTQVYGTSFMEQNDDRYKPLYEQAKSLKNVNYIGYKPNHEVIDAMQYTHIFAYPSVWEETFCISAIESMAAGNMAVVTNFGALYETCAEFAHYVNYDKDFKSLARKFAVALDFIADNLHEDKMQERLQMQMKFYREYYNWDLRVGEWISLLDQAIKMK